VMEKLGASNYAVWSIRMRSLLKLREFWAAVEANGAVDAKMDEKALALIIQYVADMHLAALQTAKTAKEAWGKLEAAYKANSTARRLQLRTDLNSLKKEGGESVAKYVSRARELGHALASIGNEVTDQELALSLLAGLPSEFKPAVTVFAMAEGLPSIDVLAAKLLQFEQTLVPREKGTDGAAVFFGQSKQRGGGSFRPGREDRRVSATDKRCFYCGKKGHLKADCFQLKRDQGQGGGGGAGRAVPSVSGAGIALAANGGPFDADTWVLDSGASQHMTPTYEHLLNYRVIAGRSVRFGDGQEAQALGVGDVQLITEVDGNAIPVLFTGVLHVPGLVTNLISVSRCVQQGASVAFEDGHCAISFDGMVVAVAKPSGGLFALNVIPAVQKSDLVPTALVAAAQLWHARLGHLGLDNMINMVETGMVTGWDVSVDQFKSLKDVVCETCVLGKHSRDSFGASTTKTSRRLELVHMDVLGPIEDKSLGGRRYAATFLDDFSGMSVVVPLEYKSDVPDAVRRVVHFLELQTGDKLRAVRTDRGGEYVNDELRTYFASKGVRHQTTAPYTPQQNGKAERLNRTLAERVRCMLIESGLPKSLWAEAIVCASYVRNRSPTAAHVGKTPHELFWGDVPDVSHLRVFGCTAFVHVPKQLRKKLDPTSRKGVFVGYESDSKAYKVLVDGKVVVSRDVRFDETFVPAVVQPADADAGPDLAALDLDDVVVPVPVPVDGPPQEVAEEFHDAAEPPEVPQQAPAEPRYPVRARAQPGQWWRASANVADAGAGVKAEPQTYEEAVSGVDAELWRQAMDEEMKSLHENDTWDLSDLPAHAKAIPVKWVYKVKRDAAGNIERYKARLVVKGYMQREGVDFTEVYAPVSKHTSLRALLALVAAEDLELHQLDVKTAFLNGELEEEIWVVQPPGYELGGKGMSCRLKKALYGLRQAPRAWYNRLQAELALHGFVPSESDPGLYVKHDKGGSTYLLVWVDDILVAGSAKSVQGVKDVLRASFDVRDLGEANFFLGMEVERDRGSKTLKLTQMKYTAELLHKYGLQGANSKKVPLSPAVKLSREGSEKLDTAVSGYGELIGSLLYLSVCTRPDITYAVGALARYMSDAREMHWECAKGVLRYLCGTAKHGIVYGGKSALAGYCDADYAGDVDTRRSTTGYLFVLHGGAISWSSKLQPTVAVSTAEAEYMSAAAAVKEALWLRKLLADLQMHVGTVQMYCDNQAALSLLKHPIASARSKHIDVVHHFARERVARGEVSFVYCQSSEMLADCLTKALPDVSFMFCRNSMGLGNSL